MPSGVPVCLVIACSIIISLLDGPKWERCVFGYTQNSPCPLHRSQGDAGFFPPIGRENCPLIVIDSK